MWLRNRPDQRQLVLDAFYDDPLIAAAQRYSASDEWQAVSQLLRAARARLSTSVRDGGLQALLLRGKDLQLLHSSQILARSSAPPLFGRSPKKRNWRSMWWRRFPNACHSTMPPSTWYFARAVLHHTSDLEGACSEMLPRASSWWNISSQRGNT